MITDHEAPSDQELCRGAADELAERAGIVAQYDRKTSESCARSLLAAGGEESSDPEVLESLLLLGISHPRLVERLDFSPVAIGRRLAAHLDGLGELPRARAVLDLMTVHFPGNRALDKDLNGVMRRQGQADQVIDKYLTRAQEMIDRGKPLDALPWLLEVLSIDANRTDVGRLVRDIRYQEKNGSGRAKGLFRLAAWTLAVAAVLSAIGLREVSLSGDYREIAAAKVGDLTTHRARLVAVEEFAREHPVWHGSLMVRREGSRLRGEVARLNADLEVQIEALRQTEIDRTYELDTALQRGLSFAENEDWENALEGLERALELAGPEWDQRDSVTRDVEAIREHLKEDR